MKSVFFILIGFLALSVNSDAGQGYDDCLRQEQTLRANEAKQCSGLQYLFNPSGCFATQKTLKEFDGGKCARLGKAENIPVMQAQIPSGVASQSGSGSKDAIQAPQESKVTQAVQAHAAAIQANPQFDSCRRQEQELRNREADLCSGVKYWFNPSACFAAKKVLNEYNEGKCRKIASAVNATPKEPAQDNTPVVPPSPHDPPSSPATVLTKPGRVNEPAEKTGEAGSLHEENARIRAENERLKAELEQLRKNINK